MRGEPRGKLKKNTERELGDCVDCSQCVKVCPTGIDIRNGVQLECINCTACIDACDKMMNAVGFEKGLIRYASENNITSNTKFRFTKRMMAYSGVMLVLLGVLAYLLASRTDVGISLLRTPGQLYQQDKGQISNLYNYRLLNKTYDNKTLVLKPENFNGTIKLVGETTLLIPKENSASGSLFITMNKDDVKERKTILKIGIYEEGKKIKTISTSFLGPFTNN
jgi:cytochrome c oxidase accessory protein FixG